jgi:hypothetical protein
VTLDGRIIALELPPEAVESLRAALTLPEKDVDIVQLAEALGQSVTTLKEWKKKAWIPYRKNGRNVRYNVSQVRAALAARGGVRARPLLRAVQGVAR